MRAFPPRLPEQPIFYPVLSEEYAVKIARDWNAPASDAGYVTRFRVRRSFLARYQAQEAGGQAHREYWIPADDLPAFNAALVGEIEVIAAFDADSLATREPWRPSRSFPRLESYQAAFLSL